MRVRQRSRGSRHSRWLTLGLASAVAVLALTSCVSLKSGDPQSKKTAAATGALTEIDPSAATAGGKVADTNATPERRPYVDPVVAANPAKGATAGARGLVAGTAASNPADIGGLTMQSTGINASRSSIFSTRPAAAAGGGAGDIPAYAPASAVNPAANSMFGASPSSPVEALPQPAGTTSGAVSGNASPSPSGGETRKTASLNSIETKKYAYLGDDDLPGGFASGLYALGPPSRRDMDDDAPAGLMKLASLSGLTRVAPNGLKLQTGNVETGCFKPQLVRMIKAVESHFGRAAIVTSGFRNVAHNRMVGGVADSLHTSCEAADIQVDGVTKWELADYLRSRPDRGGVGTYCHTQSVHIDTGSPRDWNWQCRRKQV